MTKMSLPRSLILLGIMLSPAPSAAIEKLNCPFIFTSSDPSKLERIKALLPDANAMGSVGRLNSTIDTLRRDGMTKSQIVSHLVGAYCPIVAQESSQTDAEKAAKDSALRWSNHAVGLQPGKRAGRHCQRSTCAGCRRRAQYHGT